MRLSTVSAFKNMDVDKNKYIVMNDEQLKGYQRCILDIARDCITVCESERIPYHLTGGSALGAVRHQGFIPWDDDIDIDILGQYFDRFIECFLEKYGSKYWVHTCATDNYGMTLTRIRLKDSICRTREDVENDECGFYIDIFRIENAPNNKMLRLLHGIFSMGMGFLLSCRNFYKNRKLMIEIAKQQKSLLRIFRFKMGIGWLLQFLSVKTWAILTQKVYGMCRNNESEYVTVPAGRKHYFGELYLRKDFVDFERKNFCGNSWKIPKAWDSYLTHMYGNYMSIPEIKDREKHIVLELKFPKEEEKEDGIIKRDCSSI